MTIPKKEKQGVCKKMIAEKSGREQLKKALQILFGIENQDKSTKDFQAFEKRLADTTCGAVKAVVTGKEFFAVSET